MLSKELLHKPCFRYNYFNKENSYILELAIIEKVSKYTNCTFR